MKEKKLSIPDPYYPRLFQEEEVSDFPRPRLPLEEVEEAYCERCNGYGEPPGQPQAMCGACGGSGYAR